MRLRRLAIVTCCVVVVQLAAPAPAHAWWDWIDQLSGPGPFMGWDLSYRVVCVKDPNAANDNVSLDNIKSDRWRRVARVAGVGCVFHPDTNPLSSLNVTFGQVYTKKNNLQPENDQKKVVMTRFEPTMSTFVDPHKTFEVASGVGWLLINGPAFDHFTRFYWKPVQLNIAPGAATHKRLPIVGIGVMIIPKGFDARDFGSTGTFHTDKDVLTTVSITYDFARLGK